MSVCLSITYQYFVLVARRILELFPPVGSHAILVFLYQTVWHYSDGQPPNAGVECKGYEKSRFSTNISLYIRNDTR